MASKEVPPAPHPSEQAAERPAPSGFDPSRISAIVEDGCRAVYGSNWYGPANKMPGPEMKRVWRELVTKAQSPVLRHLERADAEVEAWKRVAVLAAVALEPIRMSGAYRVHTPETIEAIDEAVVTIRMAIAGAGLPSKDDLRGMARKELGLPPIAQGIETEGHDPSGRGAKPESPVGGADAP